MKNKKTWIFLVSFVLLAAIILSIYITYQKNGDKEYITYQKNGDKEYITYQKNGDKENEPKVKVSLTLPNSEQLNIEASGLLLKKTDSSKTEYIRSTDEKTVFTLFKKRKEVGTLEVVVRQIDNGDFFIFTKLKNNSEEGYTAKISYPISGNLRYELTDFDREYIEHGHDRVYGVDPTTYPIGLLKVIEYDKMIKNMMISRNYVSRELVHEYENGDKSVLRELKSENKALSLANDNNGITVTLPLHSTGNDISENWVLVSNEPLFKNQEALDQWIGISAKRYIEINKWYTAEGPYSKLPWSIEPGTKMGYGRNLVRMQDGKALKHYKTTQERYFYDLIMNSIANLKIFQGNKEGLWETEYTSTWLKNNYGIHAPYIDTRHNENIALFLKEVGDIFDIPELENAFIDYADFLVNQVKMGGVIEIPEGGYLITDYFSPNQAKKTHVSLNHALGEMNFLLETYQNTKDQKYLEVAKNIKLGVENIGEKWIRENGDLWYQINSDLTFEGTDYVTLTLIDLLKSQVTLESIGESRSEMFDQLIRSKVQWLVDNNQEIIQSLANELNKQGFGDMIEGYHNITMY